MFFITHIDKFFHNSPGAEMCLGTPHFIGQNLWDEKDSKCGIICFM